MRSDANERVNVEVAKHEKGHGWVSRGLSGDRQAKVNQGDAMDIDVKHEVLKTATLAPGSIIQPKRRAVDFESMAFSQGGHFMLTKKVKLPDESFKRAKKGYVDTRRYMSLPVRQSKNPSLMENLSRSQLFHHGPGLVRYSLFPSLKQGLPYCI